MREIYTEPERHILHSRQSLANLRVPRVLVDLIIGFLTWDWPVVGDEVAALDEDGTWWIAVIMNRLPDHVQVHYLGWEKHFDRWLPRHGYKEEHDYDAHLRARYLSSYAKMLQIAACELWPCLRRVETLSMLGTWQRFLLPPTALEPEHKWYWKERA